MHLLQDHLVLLSLLQSYDHRLRWLPMTAYQSRVQYPHDQHLLLTERILLQGLVLIRKVP